MSGQTVHLREPAATRRRGFSICYLAIAMTAIFAVASLALDYGKVQAGKTELRRAADAAARAAATQLGSVTTVQNLAYKWAYANTCDGTPIVIDKFNDVEFWNYNPATRTHTVLTGAARSTANAVKVTCRRTLPLVAARVLGAATCDVSAFAVASMSPKSYGLVGLDSISLKGNTTASYRSDTGAVGGDAGTVASNGPIVSTNNSTLGGDVWHLPGQPISSNITATAIRSLPGPLVYPDGDPSPYSPTYNDNALLPKDMRSGGGGSVSVSVGNKKSYKVPEGHYVVNNFLVNTGGSVDLLGPVTFYVYGSFTLSGPATTNANLPKNLNIVMIPNPYTGAPPGPVTLASASALYANVYAPQSDVTVTGQGSIYGAILGKTVTVTGTGDIYYDLSLPGGGTGTVQLIQ